MQCILAPVFSKEDTKSTKFGVLSSETFVSFVLPRKYMCENDLHNEEAGWVPSYPRKRVSRLIRRKTNLDSRLRGNDESTN